MEVYNFQIFCFVLILFYVGFLSNGSDSLFSSLLLCRIIDIACCIAMVLISLKVCQPIPLRKIQTRKLFNFILEKH